MFCKTVGGLHSNLYILAFNKNSAISLRVCTYALNCKLLLIDRKLMEM